MQPGPQASRPTSHSLPTLPPPQDWFCQCFKPSQAAVEAAEAQRAEREARVRLLVRRARLLVEVLESGVCRVAQLAAQAQGAVKPPSLFNSIPGMDRAAAGVLMAAAGGGAGRSGAMDRAGAAVAQREQQAWQAQRVLLQQLAGDMNKRHRQLQSLVDNVLRAEVGAVEVMLRQVWHVAEQQQDGAERAKATHRAMMAGR